MNSFGDRSSGSIHGHVIDRRFASDEAKRRLERLENIQRQIKAAREEFTQLAIASRLKSEYDDDVCNSVRRCPVSCKLRWRQLSNGRLLIVEFTNNLSSASLIDWTAIIQLSPLGPGRPNRSCAHSVPRLDAGNTISLEIYFKHDDFLDIITRLSLVRCYLARQFRLDSTSRVLSFCISTNILAANDMVYDRFQPTFSIAENPYFGKQSDNETHVNYFRFCISRALLPLLFKDSISPERNFMQWLFPQVDRWDWDDKSGSTVHRSPVMLLGSDATVLCKIEHFKMDQLSVTIELTKYGRDSSTLLDNLKMAVLIKLLLAIRSLRRYSTNIPLNGRLLSGISEMKRHEFIDYFFSKLPFA